MVPRRDYCTRHSDLTVLVGVSTVSSQHCPSRDAEFHLPFEKLFGRKGRSPALSVMDERRGSE